jgi:hypothetical protein
MSRSPIRQLPIVQDLPSHLQHPAVQQKVSSLRLPWGVSDVGRLQSLLSLTSLELSSITISPARDLSSLASLKSLCVARLGGWSEEEEEAEEQEAELQPTELPPKLRLLRARVIHLSDLAKWPSGCSSDSESTWC